MMINQELKSVLKEIDQSNGLPNRNYTDNIQYNIEKKLLIFDQWAGVAVSEDIPNVGDAIPITFVGVPLLLLRNEKRELKVFMKNYYIDDKYIIYVAGNLNLKAQKRFH